MPGLEANPISRGVFPEEQRPATRYKFCVDLSVFGWNGTERKEAAQEMVGEFLESNGLAEVTAGFRVDASRKGFVNISLFTNELSVGSRLREIPNAYTQFGADFKDPENPRLLPQELWLKT